MKAVKVLNVRVTCFCGCSCSRLHATYMSITRARPPLVVRLNPARQQAAEKDMNSGLILCFAKMMSKSGDLRESAVASEPGKNHPNQLIKTSRFNPGLKKIAFKLLCFFTGQVTTQLFSLLATKTNKFSTETRHW